MTIFRYLLLMALCAVGTATILMEIALAIDGEIKSFALMLLIILSSIITVWIVPYFDEKTTKGDKPEKPVKEKAIKVDDTEDDDYYNSLGL